jgi:hypothetical protein
VGDRVVINSVPTETLTVRRVDFLTTHFSTGVGKRKMYLNANIASVAISNLSRSAAATFEILATVPATAGPAALEAIAKRVCAYTAERSADWLPSVPKDVVVAEVRLAVNAIDLCVWLTAAVGWGDPRIWRAKSDFLIFMLELLRELNLVYVAPVQPVRAPIRWAALFDGAGAAGARSVLAPSGAVAGAMTGGGGGGGW